MKQVFVFCLAIMLVIAMTPAVYAESNNDAGGTKDHGQGKHFGVFDNPGHHYGWENGGGNGGGGDCLTCNGTFAADVAAVWDKQGSFEGGLFGHAGGGIQGAAGAAGIALGLHRADVVLNVSSGMGAFSGTEINLVRDGRRIVGITYEKWQSNDGFVAADAKARADFGIAGAAVAGYISQGGGASVIGFGTAANAGQGSSAGFLSVDVDIFCRPQAIASGRAEVWGYSGAYEGATFNGEERWSGAYAANGARAQGDLTFAGGHGDVSSVAIHDGAIAAGTAGFCYTGNGSGSATSFTSVYSIRDRGYSYKGAHAESHAQTGRFTTPGD